MIPEKFPRKRKPDTKISQQTVPSVSQVGELFIETETIYIEGGTFEMGSNKGSDDEKPVHSVTVNSIYMGKYPVTNKEYCLYKTSHDNSGDNLPVVKVSWNNAMKYCKWLSEKTGKNYRLPTESEWEYACRAGTTTEYYWGNSMDDSYCWYGNNSGSRVHTVGEKMPNKFGLYDMSGNVWEWCSDWYGEYSFDSVTNPTGPSMGSIRVFRGGSWNFNSDGCRSARRYGYSPGHRGSYLGFRLVKTP